jgi:hypothetical protein
MRRESGIDFPGASDAVRRQVRRHTPTATPVVGRTITITAQLQKVSDSSNVLLAGKEITWSASVGGGSFASPTSTTDASGVATVVYTVPATVGATGTITATDDSTPSPVTGTSTSFTTQVSPVSAAQSTLTAAASSIAVSTDETMSTTTLTVQAKDAGGTNLSTGGSTVTISLLEPGTGTVSAVTDNGDGTYTATVTAPVTVGSGTFTATIDGSAVQGGTGSTQQVTITYTGGAAALLEVIEASDLQSAVVDTAVANPPQVRVLDAYGNPVASHSVTFTVTTGGGSLGESAVDNGHVTSGADGIATAPAWTLGRTAGILNNSIVVTSADLDPATILATATPGPASRIAINTGDGQTATVGTAVAIAPTVKVTDVYDNVVQGTSVTFTAVTGSLADPGSPAT